VVSTLLILFTCIHIYRVFVAVSTLGSFNLLYTYLKYFDNELLEKQTPKLTKGDFQSLFQIF